METIFKEEVFKDLKLDGFDQFDGLYSIGDRGTLISKARTSESTDRNGNAYLRTTNERTKTARHSKKSPLLFSELYLTIYRDDGTKAKYVRTVYIHKLVAQHFMERPKDKRKNMVAHIDPFQPTRNYPSNLMWVDQSFFSSRNMILYPENRNNLKKANIKSGYYQSLRRK